MTPVLKTKILRLETTKTRQPVSQIKIKRKRAVLDRKKRVALDKTKRAALDKKKRAALDKTKRAAALDKTVRVRKTMRK